MTYKLLRERYLHGILKLTTEIVGFYHLDNWLLSWKCLVDPQMLQPFSIKIPKQGQVGLQIPLLGERYPQHPKTDR